MGYSTCPICSGSGKRGDEACPACNGSGKVVNASSGGSTYSGGYSPSYSRSSGYRDKGGIIGSIIIGIIGAFCSVYPSSFLAMIIPIDPNFIEIPLAILVFIICFKIWRNNNKGRIMKIAVICVGFIIIGHVSNKMGAKITNSFTTKTTATVTSDVLNFRTGPSASHDIIKTLKKGDTLTVTGAAENGWVPVKHGKDKGYVSAELISKE
jgi:uncharacterized membrane protein YeaQ/YmgE (transglycosylase-associated protein family)